MSTSENADIAELNVDELLSRVQQVLGLTAAVDSERFEALGVTRW